MCSQVIHLRLSSEIFPEKPTAFKNINPNSLDNKGSCWIVELLGS